MSENNLADIIKNSLESIKGLAGVNTIIGDPINTPNGTVVIPVSKVSMGFASGGLDIPAKNVEKSKSAEPDKSAVKDSRGKSFGGGGGTGLTVTPIGFLVIKADGSVDMLNVTAPDAGSKNPVESVADLIEKSPDIISRLKGVFAKKKEEEEKEAADEDGGRTE